MTDNNISFRQYLIKLGAKNNWFPLNEAKFYFTRMHHGKLFTEIGICSQSFFSKIFNNSNYHLEIDKIFPSNSKNLYSFNSSYFDESNLPFYTGSMGYLLKSNKSFLEIAENFHLSINEIEKKEINKLYKTNDKYEKFRHENENYEFRWYEEIFDKYNINIQKMHYSEMDETMDPQKLFLNEGKIFFLRKPYLNGEYYFLWGQDNGYKYFLPQKILTYIDYVFVTVNES